MPHSGRTYARRSAFSRMKTVVSCARTVNSPGFFAAEARNGPAATTAASAANATPAAVRARVSRDARRNTAIENGIARRHHSLPVG